MPVHCATCRAAISVAVLPVLFATALHAQTPQPRTNIRVYDPSSVMIDGMEWPQMVSTLDIRRAVVGVTLTASSDDTLGVLVEDVTKDGPADKAGIRKGARITSVNGVSLRLSGSDAADDELLGVGVRRLQREVAKAKAGDEIELRVSESGQSRAVRVKTITAAELARALTAGSTTPRVAMPAVSVMDQRRASIGASIGNTGTLRDTLGLFVSSVITEGPADKAGVFEGARIAAINGTDVRVPKEDAGDNQASAARLNRFTRELAKSAPGDKITLKVFADGHYRDVQVTAGKNTDTQFGPLRRMTFGDSLRLMHVQKLPGQFYLKKSTSVP